MTLMISSGNAFLWGSGSRVAKLTKDLVQKFEGEGKLVARAVVSA